MKTLKELTRWNHTYYQSTFRNQGNRKNITSVSSLQELCRPIITNREVLDHERTLRSDRLIHTMLTSQHGWMTSREIVYKAQLADVNAFFGLINGIRRRLADKYRIDQRGKRGQLQFRIVELEG